MVLGELDTATCKKKMKLEHQLTPYAKINSRWIKDLNTSCDTIKVLENPWLMLLSGLSTGLQTKVLEENIGRKISDIPCSSTFTDMSPRARDIKERINKLDLIKIKSFCMAKENISKMKMELTEKIYLPMIPQTRV